MLSLQYSGGGGPSVVGVGWSLGLPTIERRGLASGPPRSTRPTATTLPAVAWSNSATCQARLHRRRPLDSDAPLGVRLHALPTGRRRLLRSLVSIERRRALARAAAFGRDMGARSTQRWRQCRSLRGYRLFQEWCRVSLEAGAAVRGIRVRDDGEERHSLSWRHDTAAPYDVSTLRDVYYTPPVTGSVTDASFAHHIHLVYDPSSAQRTRTKLVDVPTWLREPEKVLRRIEIASSRLGSTREQVRRYYLTYSYAILDRAYLTNVVLEGRCTPNAAESPVDEGGSTVWTLPTSAGSCPKYLPGTTYGYSPDAHYEGGVYIGGISGLRIELTAGGAAAPSPALSGRKMALIDIKSRRSCRPAGHR